jgi:hypothetical protein
MSGSKLTPEAYEAADNTGPPAFDEDIAPSYIGRTIIVGFTFLDHAGQFVRQQQLRGRIASASGDGIAIALEGERAGQNWNMPPALESIRCAPAGEYRFRETSDVARYLIVTSRHCLS